MMQHFFVDPAQIDLTRREIRIVGSDVRHIRDVLRMRVGEEVSISNGVDDREYRCEIAQMQEDALLCHLRFIKDADVELPLYVTLFQGLPKADKMELIVQKCVELGVSEIVPVSTQRSIVRLDEKKSVSKVAHWQAISEAAAKQSQRSIVPRVRGVMRMSEAVAYAQSMELAAIPYELADGMEATRDFIERTIAQARRAREQARWSAGGDSADAAGPAEVEAERSVSESERPRLGILIGPEGGFTEEEVAQAQTAGITPISLGRRILRTETAGMALLSILMYHMESAS